MQNYEILSSFQRFSNKKIFFLLQSRPHRGADTVFCLLFQLTEQRSHDMNGAELLVLGDAIEPHLIDTIGI